ncbi:MAG: hypothetical protein SGILL_002760 [Bacillariaceae sp.]
MNVLNDHGVVLSGKDLVDYARRRGLCQLCGRTQTHRRSKNLFKKLKNQWQPLTIEQDDDDIYNNNNDESNSYMTSRTNGNGNQQYLVYKGYCLQPTCYTLEEAKHELGESSPPTGNHASEELLLGNSSRRNFDMDMQSSSRPSFSKYSSARFSTSSSVRSGISKSSYEYSIAEQQKRRLLRPNELYSAQSTVSDVSSLGASAISEDFEDDNENPFIREFRIEHITGTGGTSSIHDVERSGGFHRLPRETDRPDPSGKQLGSSVGKESDTMPETDVSSDSSSQSSHSLASLVEPRGWFHKGSSGGSSPIQLPKNYNINVSFRRSSLLTIDKGSLRVLNLESSVHEVQQDSSTRRLDPGTAAEEEGIEIALAPSKDADDLCAIASGDQDAASDTERKTNVRTNSWLRKRVDANKMSKAPSYEQDADAEDGVLTVFQSAPLAYVHPNSRRKYSFPLIDFDYESQLLTQSLGDTNRIGTKVRVETEIATVDRLSSFFALGGRKVLHLSCHGHPEYLLLENGYGSAHPLLTQDLKKFVSKAELDLVFVSACYSRSAGEAFIKAGVKHVVCCRQDSFNARDEAAVEFSKHFYRALACRKPLQEAFDLAKASVHISPQITNAKEESDKFLLFPEGVTKSYHNVTISFADRRFAASPHINDSLEAKKNGACNEVLKRQPDHFLGREEDLFHLLDALKGSDWVHIHGERGSGKTTLVAAAVDYVSKRASSFMRDRIYWVKGPDGATQWQKADARNKAKPTFRPLVIFDSRVESEGWAKSHKDQFLLEVLSSGSQTKLISIGYDETVINDHKKHAAFLPRSLQISRLNHHDSVCLFSSLMSSADYTPNQLADILSMRSFQVAPAFTMDDGTGADSAKVVMDALADFRKNKVYQRIGAGLPKRIVHMASNMPREELSYCIRWASRSNEIFDTSSTSLPSTRAQLEELIQCTLAKESRALRQEDYVNAREFRETLEELQSLRSILLTRTTLEEELSTVRPKLQDATRQRRYDDAEMLRNRRNWLERQLRREDEYLQTEQRFQHARQRARSFRSTSSVGSTSSRASVRSISSRGSVHSRGSRASYSSRSSRGSRVSFGSRIRMDGSRVDVY